MNTVCGLAKVCGNGQREDAERILCCDGVARVERQQGNCAGSVGENKQTQTDRRTNEQANVCTLHGVTDLARASAELRGAFSRFVSEKPCMVRPGRL